MKRTYRAFTLIELLIVITIIAILASIVFMAIDPLARLQAARDSVRLTEAGEIKKALDLYLLDNGHYPSAGQWVSGQPLTSPTLGTTYLASIPVAPTPADGACSDTDNTFNYIPSSDLSDYSLSFCLGTNVESFTAGLQYVTPKGLVSDLTPDPDPNCDPTASVNFADTNSNGYYEVHTCCELQHMTSGNYELVNSINCSNTTAWNGGNGFAPINDFAGVLEGNNHKIVGLFSANNNNPAGIFGGDSSDLGSLTISNLQIKNFNIFGSAPAAALVGYRNYNSLNISNCSLDNTTISNSSCVAGFVGGTGNSGYSNTFSGLTVNNLTINSSNGNAGSLIGCGSDNLSISSSTVSRASITASYCAGGFLGNPNGIIAISNSSADHLTILSSSPSGGLIGCNGTVNIDSSSVSDSSIETGSCAGGLVGGSTVGTIYNSSATNLTITSTGGAPSGGLTGCASVNSISDSHAVNVTIVTNSGGVGGLAASTVGSISNSYVTNSHLTVNSSWIGGLAYSVNNDISNSYVENTIIIGPNSDSGCIGGLAGTANGSISGSHFTGTLTGLGTAPIGGLSGCNIGGNVTDSYAQANITGGTGGCAGGLTGGINGYISNSHFIGSVTADSHVPAGGLSGCSVGSYISNSYADASITQTDTGLGASTANGLASGASSISNSHFIGSINAPNTSNVAGLAVSAGGIENSYASSTIIAFNGVGGLSYNGSVTDSYFKGSINASGDGVYGLTSGSISNSYVVAIVNDLNNGNNSHHCLGGAGQSISNSYYNHDLCQLNEGNTGGTPETTAWLKSGDNNSNNFIDTGAWDFGSIWTKVAGAYPSLR